MKPRINELLNSELEFIDHVNEITADSISLWNCCQAYLDNKINQNMTDDEIIKTIEVPVVVQPTVVAKKKSYYKPKTTTKPKPLF